MECEHCGASIVLVKSKNGAWRRMEEQSQPRRFMREKLNTTINFVPHECRENRSYADSGQYRESTL